MAGASSYGGLTLPTIFKAIDLFSTPVRYMRSGLNGFINASETGIARVSRGFKRLMSPVTALQNSLRGLGLYVGLFSLMLVFRNFIGIIADFEQAQVNLASVSEATVQDQRKMALMARTVAVQYGQAAKEVSNLQFELTKMGFTAQQILGMTGPVATGAVALRTNPQRMAEVTAAILRGFEMDVGKDPDAAKRVIAQLAFAANQTSADFNSFATQLPIVARVAYQSGQSYEKVLAYLGTLSNVQIHVGTAATSLKNIIIDAAKRGQDFRTAIEKVASAKNAVVYAYNKFGKRSVVSALEFSKQLAYIDGLVTRIKNTPIDYADILAKAQLLTIGGGIKKLRSAWEELVISIDDGNGPLAMALKQYLEVGRAMLLILAGSEPANAVLKEMDSTTINLANKFLVWGRIVAWVVGLVVALNIAMAIWRALVIAATIVAIPFNIVMGVMGAITGIASVAIGSNTVALGAYKTALAIGTAAQWLFNAALWANPITWIVAGILLLIGAIVAIIYYWDDWTASLLEWIPAGYAIVGIFKMIKSAWEGISSFFAVEGWGGLVTALTESGRLIYNLVIMPIVTVLELIGKLTGSSWATSTAGMLSSFGQNNPASASQTIKPAEAINPTTVREESMMQRIVKTMTTQNVVLDINNNTPYDAAVRNKPVLLPVRVRSVFND